MINMYNEMICSTISSISEIVSSHEFRFDLMHLSKSVFMCKNLLLNSFSNLHIF